MAKFVRNQKVSFEEGLRCEFKAFANNPVQQIRNYIDIYVVSFLNIGVEGSIYFGIRDGGEAVGVSLDTERRDAVRQSIGLKLGITKPPILPSSYEIIFHDLFDGDGNPIADRPIVEVKVKPTSPRREVYFTNGEVHIKTPGGREEVSGRRLLVLQAEINEELKTGEVEAQKAEQEQKQREVETQQVQGEVSSKKKPRQKLAPTPFLNPYNSATVATEDMFKGRETEIGHLCSAIDTATHTAIFGLQRMGKTSLVKETLRRVDDNCIFAEVDLQAYGGERITYRALLHAIVTRIAEQISSSRHQSVVNEIDELARNYMRGDKHQMLDGFSAILKKIVKATTRKVVLFLDEFSELCQTIDKNEALLQNNLDRGINIHPHEMIVDVSLMHWFSSLMKSEDIKGKLVFIFAVRPFVAEYDADTHLSILKLVSPITLYHLRKEEAEALMVEPLDGKIEYEEGSIDYLYNLTAGHAYLIQFFLHEIINRIRQDGRSCIEKEDITHFERDVVSAEEVYDGQFTVLDSDYSVESVRNPDAARKGRGVLAVIAHLGDEPGDDGWVSVEKLHNLLISHGMPENEIYDILAKLRRARIIEERQAGKENLEYRISIPLLRKRYAGQNMYQRHFLQRNFR